MWEVYVGGICGAPTIITYANSYPTIQKEYIAKTLNDFKRLGKFRYTNEL